MTQLGPALWDLLLKSRHLPEHPGGEATCHSRGHCGTLGQVPAPGARSSGSLSSPWKAELSLRWHLERAGGRQALAGQTLLPRPPVGDALLPNKHFPKPGLEAGFLKDRHGLGIHAFPAGRL